MDWGWTEPTKYNIYHHKFNSVQYNFFFIVKYLIVTAFISF